MVSWLAVCSPHWFSHKHPHNSHTVLFIQCEAGINDCKKHYNFPFFIKIWIHVIVVVQLLSCVQHFSTPWIASRQTSVPSTISWSLLKFMSIGSMMQSNHLILCHPLFIVTSIFSSMRVFSNESILRIQWPKYWSFSCSIRPSNEYSGLISYKIDWFDFLAVQGALKSLQHHNSKASSLQHSAFFMVQLSHL